MRRHALGGDPSLFVLLPNAAQMRRRPLGAGVSAISRRNARPIKMHGHMHNPIISN